MCRYHILEYIWWMWGLFLVIVHLWVLRVLGHSASVPYLGLWATDWTGLTGSRLILKAFITYWTVFLCCWSTVNNNVYGALTCFDDTTGLTEGFCQTPTFACLICMFGVFFVVVVGGEGVRLWCFSRRRFPPLELNQARQWVSPVGSHLMRLHRLRLGLKSGPGKCTVGGVSFVCYWNADAVCVYWRERKRMGGGERKQLNFFEKQETAKTCLSSLSLARCSIFRSISGTESQDAFKENNMGGLFLTFW